MCQKNLIFEFVRTISSFTILGKEFYNLGIEDARNKFKERVDDLDFEIEELKK